MPTYTQYLLLSSALTLGMVQYIYSEEKQFFPTTLRLVSSKASSVVLLNSGIALAIFVFKLLRKIFLGQLRASEVELLSERLSATALDTLFAMSLFMHEFSASFFLLFSSLVISKTFHWLLADRVNFFTQRINNSIGSYFRLITLMSFLLLFDVCFVIFAFNTIMSGEVSAMLLFGFEYMILTVAVVSTMFSFGLNLHELSLGGQWDMKNVIMLYADFAVDLVQLVLYCAFFFSMMTHFGLPLHLFRQLYLAFRSLQNRFTLLQKYGVVFC